MVLTFQKKNKKKGKGNGRKKRKEKKNKWCNIFLTQIEVNLVILQTN
jgi:hypothetical protein